MTIEWDQCEINDRSLELDNPDEEIGTKLKRWIQVDGDDRPWLVKDARTDKRDMTVSGEDWAEWLAMILARQLAIPCAEIKPVRYLGNRAIASRQVFPPGQGALAHGNELLSRANPNYDRHLRSEHPGYTLESVQSVLLQVQPPSRVHSQFSIQCFRPLGRVSRVRHAYAGDRSVSSKLGCGQQ